MVQGALQHDPGQLRLDPELDLLRDPRGPAAGQIVGPCLGQVQLPVDERPPLGAGVSEKDAELAVVDLAGRARILPLDPYQVVPFFEKPVSSATSTVQTFAAWPTVAAAARLAAAAECVPTAGWGS
jgi:hypothetical protein